MPPSPFNGSMTTVIREARCSPPLPPSEPPELMRNGTRAMLTKRASPPESSGAAVQDGAPGGQPPGVPGEHSRHQLSAVGQAHDGGVRQRRPPANPHAPAPAGLEVCMRGEAWRRPPPGKPLSVTERWGWWFSKLAPGWVRLCLSTDSSDAFSFHKRQRLGRIYRCP